MSKKLPPEMKALGDQLKEVTNEIKQISKRKRSASYRMLSQFSKNLMEKELEEATGKQMDLIEKLLDQCVNNKLPFVTVENIVKTKTR